MSQHSMSGAFVLREFLMHMVYLKKLWSL